MWVVTDVQSKLLLKLHQLVILTDLRALWYKKNASMNVMIFTPWVIYLLSLS